MQEKICPKCKNPITEKDDFVYWGVCNKCITPEMKAEATKEEQDDKEYCPRCGKETIPYVLQDLGMCDECHWEPEIRETEIDLLQKKRNKLNRQISSLKKASLKAQ